MLHVKCKYLLYLRKNNKYENLIYYDLVDVTHLIFKGFCTGIFMKFYEKCKSNKLKNT